MYTYISTHVLTYIPYHTIPYHTMHAYIPTFFFSGRQVSLLFYAEAEGWKAEAEGPAHMHNAAGSRRRERETARGKTGGGGRLGLHPTRAVAWQSVFFVFVLGKLFGGCFVGGVVVCVFLCRVPWFHLAATLQLACVRCFFVFVGIAPELLCCTDLSHRRIPYYAMSSLFLDQVVCLLD